MANTIYPVISIICGGVIGLLLSKIFYLNGDRNERGRFVQLSWFAVFFCLFDTFWGIVASHNWVSVNAFYVATYIFYFMSTFAAFAWSKCALRYLNERYSKSKAINAILIMLLVVQIVILFSNVRTSRVFFIDENCNYHPRALKLTLYALQIANYVSMLILGIMELRKKKELEKSYSMLVVKGAVLLIISGVLQYALPFLPLYSVGFMILCLIVYLDVTCIRQKQLMDENRLQKIKIQKGEELERDFVLLATLAGQFEYAALLSSNDNTRTNLHVNGVFRKYIGQNDKQISKTDFDNMFKELVVAEDYELFSSKIRVENILKDLQISKRTAVDFRVSINGAIHFFRMVFAKDTRNSNNILMGVKDVSGETNVQFEKSNNYEIFKALAKEYIAIYYLNLDTDEIIPYSMNEMMYDLAAAGAGRTYSERVREYGKRYVYFEDRKNFVDKTTIDTIRKSLKRNSTYSVIYRTTVEKMPTYCEMKFVKASDNVVAMAIADKHEEIMHRYVENKISDEYEAIYYVDLDSNTFSIVKKAGGTSADVDNANYSSGMIQYASLVSEDYKNLFIKLSNVDSVREMLTTEDRREFIYTRDSSTVDVYRVVLQVVDRKPNGVPRNLILSYMKLDESRAEKLELLEKLEEQQTYVECLTSDYNALYCVNLNTSSIKEVMVSKETIFAHRDEISVQTFSYNEFINRATRFMHDEDAKAVRDLLQKDVLIDELNKHKSLIKNYRIMDAKGILHYQLKVLKMNNWERENECLICFVDVNDAYVKDSQQQQVLDVLASEYESVYYLNLEEDVLTPIRTLDGAKAKFSTLDEAAELGYTSAYKLYINDAATDIDKNELNDFGSIDNLRKELAERRHISRQFRTTNAGEEEYFAIKYVKIGKVDEEPKLVVMGLADKSEEVREKKEKEEAIYRASIDGLTDLLNKTTMVSKVNNHLSMNGSDRTAIIYIDLDHFKTVNDTLGHSKGDEVLKEMAGKLKSLYRKDDLIARLGGDEFCVFMTGIDQVNVKNKLKRMHEELVGNYSDGENTVTVTASIGCVYCLGKDVDYDELHDKADRIMYEVKEGGRNNFKMVVVE